MGRGLFVMKVDPQLLEEFVEQSGVSFRRTARSYSFTCPRCEKKDKLVMFQSSGYFICWVCAEVSNFRGKPEFALTELTGASIREVRAAIYGDAADVHAVENFSFGLPSFFDEMETEGLPVDLTNMSYPLMFVPVEEPAGRRGLQYLESRGVSEELASLYDLHYDPVGRRVVFPIRLGPRLVGWQARTVLPNVYVDESGITRTFPKILTTGERDIRLMFQDRLVGSKRAVICEGPLDALKCHDLGGNVATMGKVVSERQIQIIKGTPGLEEVYIALDKDAELEAVRLSREFADFKVYRLLPSEEYSDLGEMPVNEVKSKAKVERMLPGAYRLPFDFAGSFGRACRRSSEPLT